MSDYKVYNGTRWIDPCWHHIYYRDNGKDLNGKQTDSNGNSLAKWILLDPHNRDLYYHDGTYGGIPSNSPNFPTWKPIKCICYCNEANGFFYDSSVQRCVKKEYTNPTCEGECDSQLLKKVTSNLTLGTKGLLLWNTEPYYTSMFTQGQGINLITSNLETNTLDYAYSPNENLIHYVGYKGIKNKVWGGTPTFSGFNRINSIGIWPENRTMDLLLKTTLNCPASKVFIIGMASKYGCKLEYYDPVQQQSTILFEIPQSNTGQFDYWHTFPISLPVGNHELWFWGYSGAVAPVFGAEIYDISVDNFKELFGKNDVGSLITKDDVFGLNNFIVWSTKNFISDPILNYPSYEPNEIVTAAYNCPEGYVFSSANGFPTCIKKTEVECIDDTISEEPTSNEVLFTIKADYIIITYKFLKDPTDTWILDDGMDLYDTPMNNGTAVVKNDVQGVDLDTRTRLYAGPNQNNPVVDSHYFGFNARMGEPFPTYKRTNPASAIGYTGSPSRPSYPLNDEAILRFGGDNRQIQSESVLINIQEFKARFGPGGSAVGSDPTKQIATAIEAFNVECRGWWYVTPTRYPVAVTAKFYTDDTANGNPITLISQSNYQFAITGGIETVLSTPPVIIATNLDIAQTSNNQYINSAAPVVNGTVDFTSGETNVSPEITKRIAVLEYNAYTGVGKFVNNNTLLNVAVGDTTPQFANPGGSSLPPVLNPNRGGTIPSNI